MPLNGAVVFTEPSDPIVLFRNNPPWELDIDLDGIVEFETSVEMTLQVFPRDGVRFGRLPGAFNAVALALGDVVGSTLKTPNLWGTGPAALNGCSVISCGGSFLDKTGYLAIEFDAPDGVHYGWVEIESPTNAVGGTVRGWAYETVPGRGLRAGVIPEPGVATLMFFGLGGMLWRRRRG